ncbi:MAG TPA: hypothetical protein VFQ80_10415 [Thermomicrobiales bacterium]|jgi:hypothetical protein|nr:hypothetical protein [Thermomicrobiales bacterium]
MVKPVRYYIVKNGERAEVRSVPVVMARQARSLPAAETPLAEPEPLRIGPARRLAERLRKQAHIR